MSDNESRILLINNKSYQLIWSYEALDGDYLYLINKDDYTDILFVKIISDNEVESVKDQETLDYIIKMMASEVNTFIL